MIGEEKGEGGRASAIMKIVSCCVCVCVCVCRTAAGCSVGEDTAGEE